MEYLSGEVIAGVFATIAGAAVILQRIGILKIPTTKKDKPDNPGNDSKQIDNVKERVDRLTDVVMFKNTCDAIHKGVDDRFSTIHDMMKETRDGVRKLLGEK